MLDKDAVGYTADHPAVLASLEAMKLGKRGWLSLRDECYAWQKVQACLDPNAGSNVGQRYISWRIINGKPYYQIQLRWIPAFPRIVAPATLIEARADARLEKAIARRDQLITESGDIPRNKAVGAYAQFEAVLMATDEGREYLSTNRRAALDNIAQLSRTAAAYDKEEWNPVNSRSVHKLFYAQEDRLSLIAKPWTVNAAVDEVRRRTHLNSQQEDRTVPVRAHIRGGVQLSEDFKLEVGLMVEQGMTPGQIGSAASEFARSLADSPSLPEAVTA